MNVLRVTTPSHIDGIEVPKICGNFAERCSGTPPKPQRRGAISPNRYYNLVAGYDVFGSVAHQAAARLYMDHLRMQAENLFLAFVPVDQRQTVPAWRTSPRFWSTIDWGHDDVRRRQPNELGLFDLNRYVNL